MTLYDEITQAGIKTDNHESDLYFPKTEQSTAILKKYPLQKKNATTFKSNIEGTVWYAVPFAYEPWWEDAEKQIEQWVKGITAGLPKKFKGE